MLCTAGCYKICVHLKICKSKRNSYKFNIAKYYSFKLRSVNYFIYYYLCPNETPYYNKKNDSSLKKSVPV